jgi:hypothetical protein
LFWTIKAALYSSVVDDAKDAARRLGDTKAWQLGRTTKA